MSDYENTTPPAPQSAVGTAVKSAAADLMTAAGKKYDEALSAAASQANTAKDSVAGEVKTFATALRRASEDMRTGSLPENAIGMIADSLADVSDSIRGQDLGQMLRSANKVARENPALFLGGAVLLGFAISRFAKASSDLPAHLLTPEGRQRHEVNRFMDEGNPNTESAAVL